MVKDYCTRFLVYSYIFEQTTVNTYHTGMVSEFPEDQVCRIASNKTNDLLLLSSRATSLAMLSCNS